jgi:hypothetical protein
MPTMPRNPRSLGTKVAWKILGKPQNMQKQPAGLAEKVNERLLRFDSKFVR